MVVLLWGGNKDPELYLCRGCGTQRGRARFQQPELNHFKQRKNETLRGKQCKGES